MADVRTTLTIAEIRHAIRAPLHQLISHAESILERRLSVRNEVLVSALIEVLNRCQRTLTTLGSAADSKLDGIAFDEIAPELKEAGLEVVRIVDSIAAEPSAVDVSASMAKICVAAHEFLRDVRLLKDQGINSKPRRIEQSEKDVPATIRGLLLVVDDDENNRDVLSRRLLRDGREVMLAEGGRQAMRMLQRYPFDLVLLDIMMPDMDGYEVLAAIKNDPKLKHLPVIMITAVDDTESVARCIEMGADDYLPKPFNRVILAARVNALLERKRLRDAEVKKTAELEQVLREIEEQRQRSQSLLENILPLAIAVELRDTGAVQPMYFEDVTIVFADIVGFALSTEQIPADDLVHMLNEYFTRFDRITSLYSLEKLKTIGDCYMFAGGLPTRSSSNPVDCVLAALEMVNAAEQLSESGQVGWRLRIGVNTGPVIAGVVGIRKFAFDVWGDTVNFGARIESAGRPNRVNLSTATHTRVRDFFDCEKQEKVRVKEGREVDTYLVSGVSARLLAKTPELTAREAFAKRYHGYFRKPLSAFPNFSFNVRESNASG